MCPMTVPSSSSKPQAVSTKSSLVDDDEDDEGEEMDVDAIQERFRETERRVSEANDRWVSFYGCQEGEGSPPSPGIKVTFSCPSLWRMISEDPELSEALRDARTSDHAKRQADRMRMERLLAPVFKQEHRERVYADRFQ